MDTTDQIVTIAKFGSEVTFKRVPGVDLGNWPIITEYTYMSSIGAVTAIAVLVAICRTLLRWQQYGKLDIDDAVFVLAVICTILSSVFTIYCMDFFYVEVQIASFALTYTNLNAVVPATIRYLQVLYGVTALQWFAIFGIKTCYLIFFRKLTRRVDGIREWWWVVLGFTMAAFILNCTFGPYICADLGPDVFQKCPLPTMTQKSMTFNYVTGSLDILTDVMIISIPILLISRVRINFQRKLAVVSILTLSSAMVAVSVIRLIPPPTGKVVDTVWYIYWISFEAAIAIIMVSITGFRGIFGSSGSTRGSSSERTMPFTSIAKKITTATSRMGRFFTWSTNSSASRSHVTDEAGNSVNRKEFGSVTTSQVPSQRKRRRSFFFQWTTRAGETTWDTVDSHDEITSITALRSNPHGQPKIVEPPRSTDTTGVSMLSTTMSGLSTTNPVVSPLASGVSMGRSHRASHRDLDMQTIGLPVPGHYDAIQAPKPAAAKPTGFGSWATAAVQAAQAEYEDRARMWHQNGVLSPASPTSPTSTEHRDTEKLGYAL